MNKLSEFGLRPKEIRLMRKKDTGNELFSFADAFRFGSTESRQLIFTKNRLQSLKNFTNQLRQRNFCPPCDIHHRVTSRRIARIRVC